MQGSTWSPQPGLLLDADGSDHRLTHGQAAGRLTGRLHCRQMGPKELSAARFDFDAQAPAAVECTDHSATSLYTHAGSDSLETHQLTPLELIRHQKLRFRRYNGDVVRRIEFPRLRNLIQLFVHRAAQHPTRAHFNIVLLPPMVARSTARPSGLENAVGRGAPHSSGGFSVPPTPRRGRRRTSDRPSGAVGGCPARRLTNYHLAGRRKSLRRSRA